ncbi:MAG: hypothetical protein NUV35_07990, partial [Syntrophomonadaceae bacterium]|nr:hypothetical protein [Syntrophomonadaceae bacterium]
MRHRVSIKQWPRELRPRERLEREGGAALSLPEVVAILLGNGTREESALQLAERLLSENGGLAFLRQASVAELTAIKGIGAAKACRLKAALELARRMATDWQHRPAVRSAEDVKNLLMEDMRCMDREHFRALYLDRKNRVIAIETVSIGGLHSSVVH